MVGSITASAWGEEGLLDHSSSPPHSLFWAVYSFPTDTSRPSHSVSPSPLSEVGVQGPQGAACSMSGSPMPGAEVTKGREANSWASPQARLAPTASLQLLSPVQTRRDS